MSRFLKYVLKVLYANQKFAKYGLSRMSYFMTLMMATFYIMLTGFMILFIFMAAFPSFYKSSLGIVFKIPSFSSAIVILGLIFLILRIVVKEDDLQDSSFTKKQVNQAVNYLIAYAFIVILIIGFLGLKYLRYYRNHL